MNVERICGREDGRRLDKNGMFEFIEELRVEDTAKDKEMFWMNCETFQKIWTPIIYISYEPAAHG